VRPAPEQLAASPLFSSLTDEQLDAVARLMDATSAAEGDVLVGEGAPGFTLFVLLEGTAGVTSEGSTLAELTPGDFFGEIALLGDARRTATVTASSPVTLAVMYGSDFRVFERDFPGAARSMREAMEQRLGRGRAPE
jgi:CRP-like cAMP-binding protein